MGDFDGRRTVPADPPPLNIKVRAATGGRPATVELRRSRSGPVVLEAVAPAGGNELDAIRRMLRCIEGLIADRVTAKAAP